MIHKFLVAITMAMFLAGCTLAEVLISDPSREEAVSLPNASGELERVAMTLNQTADRRNVIFVQDADGNTVVCSEQPPDVAIAQSIKEGLDGSLGLDATSPAGTTGTDLALKVNAELVETLEVLSKRTTELEMLRVALFSTCIARANGQIDQETYETLHTMLIRSVAQYIAKDDS